MKINIGTSKGNIVCVDIKKRFKEITVHDVNDIVLRKWPDGSSIIIGWCRTPRSTQAKFRAKK